MMKRFVIASTLKPVDDVRAFWKIGSSLASTNRFEISIIGNSVQKSSSPKGITFIQYHLSRSNYLKRIFIRYQILLRILTIKPHYLAITTHELLLVGILTKIILGSKLIYDIQENYSRNAKANGNIGMLLSYFISIKEKCGAYFIDQYWLAEKCYQKELGFLKKNFTVVQNKALNIDAIRSEKDTMRILFSGTISDYSGARQAMKVMKNLCESCPTARGIFVGQVHDQKLIAWLQQYLISTSNIELILSESAIPYEVILDKIKWATLGIIAYRPNKINERKVPTKLYEYSRYQLPYLVQENTIWSRVGNKLGGAISVNFNDKLDMINADFIHNSNVTFPLTYPENDTWEVEAVKIIDSIKG